MNIVIFNDLTTSDHLAELKAESEKYTGLYVDMNEPEQRKYVKDKADYIKQLKKKVDRKRIDATKEYKIAVEKEAASIIEDLNISNLPFESLIDEYTAERKKVLDAEKARKAAVELAVKIEADHEFGLLMNSQFDSDKATAEQEQIAYEDKLKAKARQDEIFRQQESMHIKREEKAKREADTVHKAEINNTILAVLIANGINEKDAKTVVVLAAKKQLPNLSINY